MVKKVLIKKVSLSLVPALLLSTSIVNASDLNPMLQFGYDFGGKTLATVEQYDYYTGYDTAKIKAGQGLSFEAGAAVNSEGSDLELQFLVGYKFDRESAANGSVTWDRIPLTALGMIKNNRWKFGGGITYHLNPELSGSFSGISNGQAFDDSVDDTYDNAIGGVIQAQYMMSDSSAIGLRGTFIEYELKNNPSVVASGNSVGINFSYTFGKRSEFR
ncbi:MAG: Unknown protein [uncultured Sulfurovum sp.]|uniref:Outer membrane protein beta-barrel domain-containing protein n=1 Tax=uncultured Sulfurovum sp. TaxID=269237 RepID=A0A6S6SGK9_9BACT|nr:MAG: Unknown protein [uncultured Sulfurovum sp.]